MPQRFSKRGLTILMEALAASEARSPLEHAARTARRLDRRRRVAAWISQPFGKVVSALARVAPW
jgi:hypothetical protein